MCAVFHSQFDRLREAIKDYCMQNNSAKEEKTEEVIDDKTEEKTAEQVANQVGVVSVVFYHD